MAKYLFVPAGLSRFGLVLSSLLLVASGANAQTLIRGDEAETEWRYSISPYAYLPFGINGTSVVAGTEVDLDLDFSDAIDLLDFAISGRTEV